MLRLKFPNAKISLWADESAGQEFSRRFEISGIVFYRGFWSLPSLLRELGTLRPEFIVTLRTFEPEYNWTKLLALALHPGQGLVLDDSMRVFASGGFRKRAWPLFKEVFETRAWHLSLKNPFRALDILLIRPIGTILQFMAFPFVVLALLLNAARLEAGRQLHLIRHPQQTSHLNDDPDIDSSDPVKPIQRVNHSNVVTDIKEIGNKALVFEQFLTIKKAELAPKSFWYPYHIMSNFTHLDALLTGPNRLLMDLIDGKPVADIGGADGDLAFFLGSLGVSVDLIDHAPTNFNGLRGAGLLKTALSSSVAIHEIDLDSYFTLPPKNYGLIFFLGTLYHLRNPYYVLETLAKSARYCLISTRIAKLTTDKKTRLHDIPVAYLLDDREANNDPTNYWIFSEAGLRRILKRTGWQICDFVTVGNTRDSDPSSLEGDERAFCLVRSAYF